MKPNRIVALVLGCLLLLPGLALLLGGGALAIAHASARDSAGYFSGDASTLRSPTAAISTEDVLLSVDAGSPSWLLDTVDADLRLRIVPEGDRPVFVGVGRAADVATFLDGVQHDEVLAVGDVRDPVLQTVQGAATARLPGPQSFWAEAVSGPGPQELTWPLAEGRWTVVVMNADAAAGVAVEATVGARSGAVLPLALVLLGVGAVLSAAAVALVVFSAAGRRSAGPAGAVLPGERSPQTTAGRSPVVLSARLDPGLSRWQWLVKWVLALPHFVVLAFLWPVFLVLTVVAGVAVLCTGRYPRSLFDVNVGIMRWSWRVSCYATTGGPGTDRYPPFTLAAQPDYPASLDVAHPARLSRGLVLVKWLLALPHLLVLALLLGWWGAPAGGGDGWGSAPLGGGLLGLLTLVAGVVLLVTGRYPPALFDLVVGLNRWVYRVVAYVALMTDDYPPFRLDQGGSDTVPPLPTPRSPTSPPTGVAPAPAGGR